MTTLYIVPSPQARAYLMRNLVPGTSLVVTPGQATTGARYNTIVLLCSPHTFPPGWYEESVLTGLTPDGELVA